MAINTGLASLSETLWTVATAIYMLAVVAYTGEYAFGRSGRIASTSPTAERSEPGQPARVREPALVGESVRAAGTGGEPADTGRADAGLAAEGVADAAGADASAGDGAADGRPYGTTGAGQRWGRW